MLLPEQGSEIAICGPRQWDPRKLPVFVWHELLRRLPISFGKPFTKSKPEARLAQVLVSVGCGAHGDWSRDPALLGRVEAQLAATNDVEVRKVFAMYLCEP
jgi:hypothetical protein